MQIFCKIFAEFESSVYLCRRNNQNKTPLVGIVELSRYIGCTVKMLHDVELSNMLTLNAGDREYVTPWFTRLVAMKFIPHTAYLLEVRNLNQLEPTEVKELARIVAPREHYEKDFLRTVVYRPNDTLSVPLGRGADGDKSQTYQLVITREYNMSVMRSELLAEDIAPIVTAWACQNQMQAFKWMLDKRLDVFNLVDKKLATNRKTWTQKDYDNLQTNEQ